MARLRYLLSAMFALLLSGLTGCTVGSFPDASVNAGVTPVGHIHAADYGGHAPLVGAHIYLVEPGTTGYGSVVKSLINSTANGAVQNGSWTNSGYASDEFVPTTDSTGKPFYGLQTDASGTADLTGDYTCDVGSPVYLIGYGGSPTFPSQTNTFAISQIVVSGSAGAYVYTFTVSAPPELAYIGESVSLAGLNVNGMIVTSTGPLAFTNAAPAVIAGSGATALSTTQFSLTSTTGAAGTYTPVGLSVTFAPTFNPAAVNMAVLGICPTSGTFATGGTYTVGGVTTTYTPLTYVYMNEVSTAATAYAFAGFVNTSATAQAGNDEFHIGSSGTAQALLGLQNATLTAANLYNIQGTQGSSTVFAGEGHLANTATVGGNGVVPQTTLDTLGNILAACVDSQNTYRITAFGSGTTPDTFGGTASTACTTLFQWATDNGVYDTTTYNATLVSGHQPYNTAQAAFNIARFPQGEGTGTTTSAGVQTVTPLSATSASNYVTALFNVPAGVNVPFTPNLSSAPDSWVVPIAYSATNMTAPYRNAIDSQGNVWVIGKTNPTYALQFNNQGVLQFTKSLYSGNGIAIDQNDAAWIASNSTNSTLVKMSKTGTVTIYTPGNLSLPSGIAIDAGNNVWVSQTGNSNIMNEYSNGGAQIRTATYLGGGGTPDVEGIAIDSNGTVWGSGNYFSDFYRVTVATGNVYRGVAQADTLLPAIDASGNAWFTDSEDTKLTRVVVATPTPFAAPDTTESNLSGIGIDGDSNIWVSYAGTGASSSKLAEYNNAGTYIGNFAFPGQNGTRGAQIDSSGNVWVVEYGLTSANLIELVGAARPVVTPLALGTLNGTLGAKP